jgi:hypothetical protein
MLYTNRFIVADNIISHLNNFVNSVTNQAILASFAGFYSVSAITVFELSIKEIFNEFAKRKNKYFGVFVEKSFYRLNGRIKISDLRGEHIKQFGDKYLNKFDKILQEHENYFFNSRGISIIASYSNLITCRHNFVHLGSPTLTINEVIDFYNHGKEIIHCLNKTMKR